LLLGFFAALTAEGGVGAGTGPAADGRGKIQDGLWEATDKGPTEFLVVLRDRADLRSAARGRTKADRGRFVSDRLREVARTSQAPLLRALEARGVPHRSYWIQNMVWIRGDRSLLEAVARRPEVLRIEANPAFRVLQPLEDTPSGESTTSIEWNILRVLADHVWSLDLDGEGVIIGGQDTGYQWDHPALRESYRGWDGAAADHDYSWHDAVHAGGGVCGADSPVPCDDHGHGTHTMGTMVGDDGGVNQIGMAPGARWIGCRNMDQGVGTPATYIECFQWFVAPTDRLGQNPDPSRAPHVINNSWSCPPSEGCSHDTLLTVVENTRAAGIVVVVSAGNEGSGCGSVAWPPAIHDASFSVGATDSADQIASFSSRGPVTVDGSQRLKPNISAPGVAVRSSVPQDGYATLQGTSMASPHVAGLVALLLSARPDLTGQVDEIEKIIELTASPLTSVQDCGDIPGTQVPNNTFGHGRIDAWAAVTGDPDTDGYGNLEDCRPTDALVWSPPGAALGLDLAGVPETTLSWRAPSAAGGAAPVYDVLRSSQPGDFSAAACLAGGMGGFTVQDDGIPSGMFSYLIRVRNGCGETLGLDSAGAPRAGAPCPITEDSNRPSRALSSGVRVRSLPSRLDARAP
jgi:subtilisin family serine protease